MISWSYGEVGELIGLMKYIHFSAKLYYSKSSVAFGHWLWIHYPIHLKSSLNQLSNANCVLPHAFVYFDSDEDTAGWKCLFFKSPFALGT